jgi:biopolymer transport protein ExbB
MSKMTFMNSAIAQTLSTQLTTATATISSSASAAAATAQQAAAQVAQANPYGLAAIWSQGDWVAKACLLLLVIMSVASWAVMVRKYVELRRTEQHNNQAHAAFDNISTVGDNLAKLSKDNPLRFVNESGADAVRQYAALRPRVDYDTWLIRAIESALSRVQTRMQEGLALLATIGSTAPFVGLFGTVWAIYSALVKIGASGQASIDRVAGPVGEALIMTAIGLAVAVPAVFGYNWLLRKNKLAMESMRSFGSKLHIVLLATEKADIKTDVK